MHVTWCRDASSMAKYCRAMRGICDAGVAAALAAGAGYADARAVVRRSQSVGVKNGRVDEITDAETEGIGVRVLVDGAWGFAGDRRLDEDGARDAALRACAFARAAAGRGSRSLAPVDAASGTYRTPADIDPFAVSLEDKIAHCLAADAALAHPEVIVRQAFVRARRELRQFVSSEGAALEQELVECGGGVDAVASDGRLSQTRSWPSAHTGSSAQGGWEAVTALRLVDEGPRVAEQAAALLRAEPGPAAATAGVGEAGEEPERGHDA